MYFDIVYSLVCTSTCNMRGGARVLYRDCIISDQSGASAADDARILHDDKDVDDDVNSQQSTANPSEGRQTL